MRNEKGQFVAGCVSLMKGKRRLDIVGINNPMKKEENKLKISVKMIGNKNGSGHKCSSKMKDRLRKLFLGKKLSEEHKQALKKPKLNGASKYWFGSRSEYKSLHHWVNRHFGQPSICEECGKSGLKNHQIHWANISGSYLKERIDWQRLCAKCHAKKDKLSENVLKKENA